MASASAAWLGREVFQRSDWEYTLTPDDVVALQAALSASTRVATPDLSAHNFPLGDALGQRWKQIQTDLEILSGVTRIRGLPIDRWTPGQVRRVFRGLVRHLGTPVSQSATGETLFDVRDAGLGDADPRTRGPNTRKRLSFHTDRCDVIGFLCLRPAKSGGENFVVDSRSVYSVMHAERPDLVEELKRPYYYKRHTVDAANHRAFCQQPIFSFCEGHFACSYLRVLIDRAYASPEIPEMTAQQREALDYLEAVAERPELHVRFQLERGDMLFLNNWTTLHRRSAFEDHHDPAMRRHLLRVWLSVPNSRPIDPRFADNFGATAAGALRGGMRAG